MRCRRRRKDEEERENAAPQARRGIGEFPPAFKARRHCFVGALRMLFFFVLLSAHWFYASPQRVHRRGSSPNGNSGRSIKPCLGRTQSAGVAAARAHPLEMSTARAFLPLLLRVRRVVAQRLREEVQQSMLWDWAGTVDLLQGPLGETAADVDRTRTGRGPHDRIQRNGRGPFVKTDVHIRTKFKSRGVDR
eukprot:gene15646-biopygen3701